MRPVSGSTRISCAIIAILVGAYLAVSAPRSASAEVRTLNQLVRRVTRLDPALGNSAVTALLQTRNGYIWVGTESGLARFDGVRFEVFNSTNTSALSTDHISSLCEDANGTLWIGTFGGGVIP